MLPYIFAEPVILVQGIIAGLVLGVLLQKSKLAQFNVIVGQFLLKDFTMLKVMMTAIIVGGIGIHALLGLGLPLQFHPKGLSILVVVVGGAIFGIGMAILGYCPGTCVAAAGQGSGDARWGILGMLLGAWAYAEVTGYFVPYLRVGKVESTTLPTMFGVSPWFILLVLTIGAIVLFRMLRRKPTT